VIRSIAEQSSSLSKIAENRKERWSTVVVGLETRLQVDPIRLDSCDSEDLA
jgi:hypothetical protein